MLGLTQDDCIAVDMRTSTIIETLFDDYAATEQLLTPESEQFISIGGQTDGLVMPNPYEFFFEYQSTCVRVTYPKGHDTIMDLGLVSGFRDKLTTMSGLALEALPYLEGANGEHLIAEKFWMDHSSKFGVEAVVSEDGNLIIDVLVGATVTDFEYDDIVTLLNAMQGIVFIIDDLIAKTIDESVAQLAG